MNSQAVIDKLQQGLKLHQSGLMAEAVRVYEEILKTHPESADALHLCGLALSKLNQLPNALEYLERAVQLNPSSDNFLNSYGSVLLSAGRVAEAIDALEQSVARNPKSVQAYLNLGDACKQNEELTKSVEAYRNAFLLKPDMKDTRFHLANSLRDSENNTEAIEFYLSLFSGHPQLVEMLEEGNRISIPETCSTEPLHVGALNNLAVLLIQLKRITDAISILEYGIHLVPEHVNFHINLGLANSEQNCREKAIDCFLTAVELDPENANAHFNAGHAYQNLGKYSEAIACYQRAIQIKPDHFESYNNSGMIYLEAKEFRSALESFTKALELAPDNDEIRYNLGCVSVKTGYLSEAKKHFETIANKNLENELIRLRVLSLCPELMHSNGEICSYRESLSAELEKIEPKVDAISLDRFPDLTSPPPYNLQFHGLNDRPIKEKYARIYRNLIRSKKELEFHHSRSKNQKPVIGFLISSGHEGPFVRFLGGVLERLNYDSFDACLFCGAATLENRKSKLKNDSIRYVPLPLQLDHAMERISATNPELLYHWEVGSDSINYLIPFYRLANKQVVSMGLPVTTGISEIDYFLSSKLVEPEDHSDHYTEKVLLGETLLSWQTRRVWNHDKTILEQLGLSHQNHLYFCGHKIQKFHPDFDQVIGEILERDSNGLFLIPGDNTGLYSPALMERLRKQFPDVAERIKVLPRLNYDQYLSLVKEVDVLLDPYHYGGGLSSYDGFSLNKVIVTRPGEFHRGRYTQAFYQKMGLGSLISPDQEKYIEQAVRVGSDSEYRIHLENQIADSSDVLFENQEVVREYQEIFEKLIHE